MSTPGESLGGESSPQLRVRCGLREVLISPANAALHVFAEGGGGYNYGSCRDEDGTERTFRLNEVQEQFMRATGYPTVYADQLDARAVLAYAAWQREYEY